MQTIVTITREYLILLYFLKIIYIISYIVFLYVVSIKISKSIYKEKNHRMKYSCISEINRSNDYNYHDRLIITIREAEYLKLLASRRRYRRLLYSGKRKTGASHKLSIKRL